MDRLVEGRHGIDAVIAQCNQLAEAVERLQAENATLKRRVEILRSNVEASLPNGVGFAGWNDHGVER